MFKNTINKEHFVNSCTLQRNMSLAILNFQLRKQQINKKIEIIFRFNSNNLPENDEII